MIRMITKLVDIHHEVICYMYKIYLIFHTEFREAVNILTHLLNVKSQMNKSQDLIYLHFCMSCMVWQKQLYINGKKMLATWPNLFTYLIDVCI